MEATALLYDTQDQPETLAEQIRTYISTSGKSIKQVAAEADIGRSTLNLYLNGNYASNPVNVEQKIKRYLAAVAPSSRPSQVTAFPSSGKQLEKRTEFFESSDARSVLAVCTACQKHSSFGLITAKSGYGKTHALRYFEKMERVAYVRGSEIMRIQDILRENGAALGLSKTYGTYYQQMKGIVSFCNTNPGYLIIVDEADKLLSKHSQKKLEIFRDIFDSSSVGVVLCGEPKLQMMLELYMERTSNRIVYQTELTGLTPKELDQYLEGYAITPEALTELRKRGCTGKSSCFRLLSLTLDNVMELLKQTGETTITLPVIHQACSMMAL